MFMFSMDYNELIEYNEKLFETEQIVLASCCPMANTQHSSITV